MNFVCLCCRLSGKAFCGPCATFVHHAYRVQPCPLESSTEGLALNLTRAGTKLFHSFGVQWLYYLNHQVQSVCCLKTNCQGIPCSWESPGSCFVCLTWPNCFCKPYSYYVGTESSSKSFSPQLSQANHLYNRWHILPQGWTVFGHIFYLQRIFQRKAQMKNSSAWKYLLYNFFLLL